LHVFCDNRSAVACYRAQGFTEVPERSRADVWFMAKNLRG